MTRDLTRAQFNAALARQGFRNAFMGIWYEHRDFPGVSFGGVLNARTGKLARRSTLARLMRARDDEEQKREAASRPAARGQP